MCNDNRDWIITKEDEMSRTFSTITWGLALVVGAVVFNLQMGNSVSDTQSNVGSPLMWGLVSAGLVAIFGGAIQLMFDASERTAARDAKAREDIRAKCMESEGLVFETH